MTNSELLLQQILVQPDDLHLRLVYADALDEEGDEKDALRAAFIRSSIRLQQEQPDFLLDLSMNHKVYNESASPLIREVYSLYNAWKWILPTDYPDTKGGYSPSLYYYSSVWSNGFMHKWIGVIRGWAIDAKSVLSQNPVDTVKFSYSFHPMRWEYDSPNRMRSYIWELEGYPRVVYTGATNWGETTINEVAQEVYKKWWPSVRRFEW